MPEELKHCQELFCLSRSRASSQLLLRAGQSPNLASCLLCRSLRDAMIHTGIRFLHHPAGDKETGVRKSTKHKR